MNQIVTTAEMFQSATRAATVAASGQATPLTTEVLTPRCLPAFEADIRGLSARALVPNVFLGADVLIAAGQHFRDAAAPHVLAVWAQGANGHGRRLVGLLAYARPGLSLPGNLLKGWTHPFVAHGTPLIDRELAGAVWRTMIEDLTRRFPDLPGLLLKDVDATGPFADLIADTARERGLTITSLTRSARAVSTGAPLRTEGTGKAGKELRRQRRRLAEAGTLSTSMVTSQHDMRRALETFLTLEAAGWKGEQASALVQSPDSANFTRAMLRSAGQHGNAAVAELSLDGRVIASALLVISGTRGALWKIAYDETFARFSPGSLLVEDITRWMRSESGLSLLDSCAHAGHAMIESLWSERLEVSDLIVGIDADRPGLTAGIARERLRRSLRGRVKAVYNRLRSFRPVKAVRAATAG